MSFLSYLSHPALVVASVGGVSLGVVLLLLPQKTVTFGSPSPSPFFTTQVNALKGGKKSSSEQKRTCHFVKGFDDVINTISSSLNHVAISCKNYGWDDVMLVENWVALFPVSLFKVTKDELMTSKELSIKTVTTEIVEEERDRTGMTFRTEFLSDKFSKEKIIGNWKNYDWEVSHRIMDTVDVVNVEEPYSSEKIYFVNRFSRR